MDMSESARIAHREADQRYYSRNKVSKNYKNNLKYYLKLAIKNNMTLQQYLDFKMNEQLIQFQNILMIYNDNNNLTSSEDEEAS